MRSSKEVHYEDIELSDTTLTQDQQAEVAKWMLRKIMDLSSTSLDLLCSDLNIVIDTKSQKHANKKYSRAIRIASEWTKVYKLLSI